MQGHPVSLWLGISTPLANTETEARRGAGWPTILGTGERRNCPPASREGLPEKRIPSLPLPFPQAPATNVHYAAPESSLEPRVGRGEIPGSGRQRFRSIPPHEFSRPRKFGTLFPKEQMRKLRLSELTWILGRQQICLQAVRRLPCRMEEAKTPRDGQRGAGASNALLGNAQVKKDISRSFKILRNFLSSLKMKTRFTEIFGSQQSRSSRETSRIKGIC